MLKRYLAVGFSIFLIGVIFAARAQDGEEMSQPTIDAAVATLIAQTQQPLAVTQTIQAALEQALTATAQAVTLPEPPATQQPFDVENFSAGSITEIDLIAGPGRTGAYLSPDGERFAYLEANALCIYAGSQQQTCVDISEIRQLDAESIRWSPDSRYLTMTENFFITFIDPDIWLVDSQGGTLANLTDDGVNRSNILTGDWRDIDLLPAWTDDGHIIFVRYARVGDAPQPPKIYRIAVDGSGETLLGTIDTGEDAFAIFTLDVWRDKLVYAYYAPGENPSNGIWISDLDGKNARQINRASREAPVSAVELSPDGKYALYRVESTALRGEYTPETSWMRVVEIDTGREILLDAERFVAGAGWSPYGSALVYTTYDALEQSGSVFLTDAPGKAGTLLMDGRFNVATGRLQQFFTWGTNNVILLSRSPQQGITLVGLE